VLLLDAALAKNLRWRENYCPESQKMPPGGYLYLKYREIEQSLPDPYLSDYFGTSFAKIRLSCNSLKNMY